MFRNVPIRAYFRNTYSFCCGWKHAGNGWKLTQNQTWFGGSWSGIHEGNLGTRSASFSLHSYWFTSFWKINLQHHQKNMPHWKLYRFSWNTFPQEKNSSSGHHFRRPKRPPRRDFRHPTSSDSCFVGCRSGIRRIMPLPTLGSLVGNSKQMLGELLMGFWIRTHTLNQKKWQESKDGQTRVFETWIDLYLGV